MQLQSTPSARPHIDLAAYPHHDAVEIGAQLLAAMAPAVGMYVHGGRLVEVAPGASGAEPREISVDRMLVVLSRAADWVRGRRRAYPDRVARAILDRPPAGVPILVRVARGPLMLADGRMLAGGYDTQSGILCAPSVPVQVPPVSLAPTAHEIASARELLVDLIADMPMLDAASWAHALAMITTPIIRPLLGDLAPMYAISAPAPGAGKSLLAQVASIIATGERTTPTVIESRRDDSETRRQLIALLSGQPDIVLLDNLADRLDSPALSALLTSPTISDRVVRTSATRTVQAPPLIIATANGLALSAELSRRTVIIRLGTPRRGPWRHHPLLDYVRAARPQLIWAIATVARAWISAGCPIGRAVLASYETWAARMSGLLDVAGVLGLLTSTPVLDPEEDTLAAVVAAWAVRYGSTLATATQVVELCTATGCWPAQVVRHSTSAARAQATGRWLTGLEGRVVGSWRVGSVVDARDHRRLYQLMPVAGPPAAGECGGLRGISTHRAGATPAVGGDGDPYPHRSPAVPGEGRA